MTGEARSAGGGWTLRAICLLGAAAMAAAGAYLFEPALADLGLYVERGKYALAGTTLIYAALLVAFAATAGAPRIGMPLADYALSLVAGPIALLAVGFLFAALAADALLYRDPANTWVGLLAIAAVLCFAAASLPEFAEAPSEASADAEDGRASGGTFGGFLTVVFYFTLSLAAIVVYINIGYLLFYLLQANLLNGNDIDLSRVGPALIAVLREVLAERWLFVVVMGALGSLLIYAFAGLTALGARATQRTAQDISAQDESFLDRCEHELRAYAEARGYGRDVRHLLWLGVLPSMFAPMFVTLVVGLNLHNWLPRPYDPAALDAIGWNIYDRSVGPSLVMMLFAALLWGALPHAAISRLSRAYSEAVGWSGFATQQLSLRTSLRSFLRAGVLSPEQPFAPGAFLHRVNTMYEPYFLFPAVALSLLAAIAWHHDMSRYHVLTDSYLEVMTYRTLERQRYPYQAVREVDLACTYDDGRPVAAYRIALPDGFSIDVLDGRIPDRVTDLARVDALIPDSVPRTYATRKPPFRDEVGGYDPICVEEIAMALPADDAGRLRAVFRTEDWHRARWRERIGAPK